MTAARLGAVLALAAALCVSAGGAALARATRRRGHAGARVARRRTARALAPSSEAGSPGEGTGSGSSPPAEAPQPPSGSCRIVLEAPSATLAAGEAVTLAGQLSCPLGGEAAQQSVTLEQHSVGVRGFAVLGTVRTDAGGDFRYTASEPLTTDSVFRAEAAGTRSARCVVAVAPVLTLMGPPRDQTLPLAGRPSAVTGARRLVTFTGTVSPVAAGARVVLERESLGSELWRPIGIGTVAADGRYVITHGFKRPGPATLRALVHVRGMRTSVSEPVAYEVAAPQNARLTISSSSLELAAGESVTIAGSAPEGAVLTLLARVPGGHFEAVATTTAGADGRYAFGAQAPPRDTQYRVRGPRGASRTLFEAVRPTLVLKTPSSTLAAGEELRVCGELTPASAGEAVVLQRESRGGVSFEDVGEDTLGEGSEFCIEAAVGPPGSQQYRVKVPAAAGLQASASAPFTLEVLEASTSQAAPVEAADPA